MEIHLMADVHRADYLIDLSNVMKDERLGGSSAADLRRFARTIDALVRSERDPHLLVYAVADNSLLIADLYRNKDDLRTLRRWQARRLIDVVADADERLLELAQATDIPIVTSDHFTDHRDAFPELQGSHGRLVEIARTLEGEFVARPVYLAPMVSWQVSRSQEKAQLKRQGLLAGRRRIPRRDVIGRLWRCPRPRCSLYDGSGGFVFLPRVRNGVVTCELHGVALEDAGRRPITAQMKVLLDGECVARFALPAATMVNVGRAPGPGGVDLGTWIGDAAYDDQISRVHLTLELRDETVYVCDLSTNGTRVSTSGKAGDQPVLQKGRERGLGFGESVLLSRRVAITRSGRRFPSELTGGRTDGTAPTPHQAPPTARKPMPTGVDD